MRTVIALIHKLVRFREHQHAPDAFSLRTLLFVPVVLATFLSICLIYEDREYRDAYVQVTHRCYGWPWTCAGRHVRRQYDREQVDDDFRVIDEIDLWSVDPLGLFGNLFIATTVSSLLTFGPRAVAWAFSADPYNDRGSMS